MDIDCINSDRQQCGEKGHKALTIWKGFAKWRQFRPEVLYVAEKDVEE